MNVPNHLDRQGYLVAFDGAADFQLNIRRVFVVSGYAGAVRGKHAHRDLTQILVCVSGMCRVVCDDGQSKREVLLDRPDVALRIPNHIWAEQYYLHENTVVMVLCDFPYDENDYIRNYDDFLAFRKAGDV